MGRRLLLLASALSIAGCGSTTFGGLGGDDDSGFFDDTGSGSDAIFPTDDATAGDSLKTDTTPGDGGGVDTSVELDTASGLDTAGGADTGGGVDSEGTDTASGDTGTPDTGTPDTGTPDTGTPDTGTSDTGTPDTGPDGGPTVPSVAGKKTCYDTETVHGPEQCSNTCCLWNVFGTWHSDCVDTCVFSRTFDCDEKADCSGGNVCCTSTNIGGDVNGSSCESSCGSDLQLCSTTAECASGKTCTAYTPPDAKWTAGACK